MHFNLLTLFPDMFPGFAGQSLAGRAREDGKWSYTAVNIRDFAKDKHKTVDDTPFGGGAGMVMRPDVIEAALLSIENPGRLVYMSPRGTVLNQKLVQEFAGIGQAEGQKAPALTILCGRYEGVDQRVLDAHGFEEVSIGDYVLSGGEPAALIVMDACIRLLDGVMGNAETVSEESFSGGLLEYPHYTRPAEWTSVHAQTHVVPDVLRSGNHGAVAKWRREQAEALTKARRPDLLGKKPG